MNEVAAALVEHFGMESLPVEGTFFASTYRSTVETAAGEIVRTLASRAYPAGPRALVWNGLDRQRRAVKGGRYVVRVAARNALGTIELTHNVRVQRIVGR